MDRCPMCHLLPEQSYSTKTDRWSLFCGCIPPGLRCDGHHVYEEAVACWQNFTRTAVAV